MIEWKGLFANTPYSSANNKTQDDAVVGMQDTIYVTGPGYGGYSANVRVHNASGAVVALIPVSGGGGALSAPAPVRILDDSTTYSYSLEVVRGAVPSDDADKIAIRIVGGASKRYPGQGSTLSDGSTSFAGPLRVGGELDATVVSGVPVVRRLDAVVKNIEQSGYGSIHNSSDRTHQHNAVVVPCSGGGYTILNWETSTLGVVSLRLALAPTLKHDGVGLAWVNATFSGSAGVTVAASTADANNNRVPGSATCDPVVFPDDVARTDFPDSPYRIIVARIETSGPFTLQSNIVGDGYTQNTAHECQEYFGAVANTGGFTGSVGVGDGGDSWYLWLPGFFSITPTAAAPSIQTHGDSIIRQGWLFGAQKLLAAEGVRFSVASSAAGQSNKASAYARFLAERGIGRSSMYLWQAYSPNDSADTLVCIANGYKYTRLVLSDLWANNITPIIVMFPTVGANNAAKQAAWLRMRTWLQSLDAAKKIHLLNTSALSNPATPWFYLPEYSSDGTHLTAAGVAVCANALAAVVRMHA